jgi:hypothetical protein
MGCQSVGLGAGIQEGRKMIKNNFHDYTKPDPQFEENAKLFTMIIRIFFIVSISFFILRMLISLKGC